MAEGILTLYSANVWSKMTKKFTKTTLHWVLQVFGSGFGIAGSALIIDLKDGNHFVSIHAITGLISMVFLVITFLNGITAYYATKLRGCVKPVYNKLFHNCAALMAFVVGKFIKVLIPPYYTHLLFPI